MLRDELIHFLLSIFTGIIIGYFTQNWWAIPVALISGFFIDIDHFFDYFKFVRCRRFDLKEFTSAKYFDYSNKVYLPLHGYEYGILLIIIAVLFPLTAWWTLALGLSLILHLIYDMISNRPIWPTYFLFFRAAERFDHKKFDFKCQR